MRRIEDDALVQKLRQMTQMGQVGTLDYLMTAGEIQSRKDARAKAAVGQGNPTPVIADLLTGGAMPPQMPMLPENAGGVAALPAPNMDNVAEMAAGGLVAFEKGGITLSDVMRQATMDERRYYQQTGQLPSRLQQMLRGETEPPAAPTGPGRQTSFVDGLDLPPARFSDTQRFYPGIAPLVQRQQNEPTFTPSVTGMPTGTADFRAQMRQADNAGLAALAQQAGPQQAGAQQAGAQQGQPQVQPAGVAPGMAAVPPLSVSGALDQGVAAAKGLMGEAPKVPEKASLEDIKKAYTDEQQLFKDLGIADPTQMRRDQLEKEIASAKSDKEQAGWMRLAEFGFNWASQNGPALQAAAKAGAAVMPGLMSDLKDLRKVERDQQKELAGIAALDAQSKRDMTAKARDRLNSERARAEDRLDNYNKQLATIGASLGGQALNSQTQRDIANLQASTQRDIAGMQASALKDERELARKDARAKVALESAEEAARDITDPTEKSQAIKRYFREFYSAAYGGGATAAPRAQGKVVNGVYVPAGN
jgi:hypothetical protein